MRASDQWFWQYNESIERLTVVLSEELVHHVPYKASKLVAMVEGDFPFDCDDAQQFQHTFDYLESFDQIPPVTVMATALNAAAWLRFGRPQMPQSWHFQQSETSQLPADKKLCELNSGFTKGLFYIVDSDDEFAVCMLLDREMAVSDIKTLKQFDTVKVLLNRLQPSTIDPVSDNSYSQQHTA